MQNIKAKEYKEKIESGKDAVIIDVRTPKELEKGRIKGSINIPLDEFENVIEEKVKDKNSELYIYCLSGSRSRAAGQILESKGYKTIYNLTHGLLEWKICGYPLVN